MSDKDIIGILNQGGVGVLPTDTQYGLVASALNQKAVEKVYELRKRSPEKPFIILISSIDDLKLFEISLNKKTINFLNTIWPNPVSIILNLSSLARRGLARLKYLHRGTDSLAFRIPKNDELIGILKITGPLIAPSANFEGHPYARTINEAKEYFKDNIDFYVDKGTLESSPSTLIKIDEGKIEVLREGIYMLQ